VSDSKRSVAVDEWRKGPFEAGSKNGFGGALFIGAKCTAPDLAREALPVTNFFPLSYDFLSTSKKTSRRRASPGLVEICATSINRNSGRRARKSPRHAGRPKSRAAGSNGHKNFDGGRSYRWDRLFKSCERSGAATPSPRGRKSRSSTNGPRDRGMNRAGRHRTDPRPS
jgi:hypothetical protein